MAIFIKSDVESSVRMLVGLPLWGVGRAADLAWFQFGGRRAVRGWGGEEKTVGDYALHVQCPWRITNAEAIVTGRGDIFCAPEEIDEPTPTDFDWQKGNRFDRIVQNLFGDENTRLSVRGVEHGEAGTLNIILEDAYNLRVFPHDSESGEHWRFFRPYTNEPHVVFTGRGFQMGAEGVTNRR